MRVSAAVALLLACVLVRATPQHVGQAPCNRHAYLAPAPTSLAEFEERVIRGPYAHLVRVTNASVASDRQFVSTWEKLAIIYHKELKIVQYSPGDEDRTFDNRMAAELGVASEDLPYVVLYDGLDADADPDQAREEALQRRRVAAAECASGTGSVCDDRLPEQDDVTVSDVDDTPDAAVESVEDDAALERVQRERLKLMHHRRLGTDEPTSLLVPRQYSAEAAERTRQRTPSFQLIQGGGSSYGLIRRAIDARLDGCEKGDDGFYRKRQLQRK